MLSQSRRLSVLKVWGSSFSLQYLEDVHAELADATDRLSLVNAAILGHVLSSSRYYKKASKRQLMRIC